MKRQVLWLHLMGLIMITIISCESYDLAEPDRLVPATVDEDPSLPSIMVNNTMLHAATFGDPNDPLVVVIHGGPGDDYRSILNCKDFANDGFFVVFYDQRGCGLSQRHEASIYTTQIMIDDLAAVIDYYQKPGQKLFLVGHSWGAMLAPAYVGQNIDRVDGMILMEPGGLTWEITEAYIERTFSIELLSEELNDLTYQDQFISGSSHEVLDYHSSLFNAFTENDSPTGDSGITPFWRAGAVCSNALIEYAETNGFDFTTNLDQYKTKVLFVYSELNQAYGREHAETVSAPFQNIELVEAKGTGHEIPLNGWDYFYPIAQSYLNSLK
ncbi:MAG: alpha/beta hydrolase [Chitinophagales bacterium]|nr:alpha/beta hydrolase [Chitinophagales bacterium]